MKRLGWIVAGVVGIVGSAYGCAFNPFSPPDYEDRPGAFDAVSSSTGGSGGMGGSGGLAGAGGLAGQGGAGGVGGAVCVCDGVDDGNECTTDVMGECPDGDMAKCHSIEPGKSCSAGPNYVCDLQGKCEGTCLMCTDEPGCTSRCEKLACVDAAGCANGLCEQGVCCREECVGPCRSCNREGTVGTCQEMPLGKQEPQCTDANACNIAGECVTRTGLPLGGACNTANQCMSLRCRAGCVSAIDEPCVEDLECASNRCDPVTKVCKPCSGMGAVSCRPGTMCLGAGVCQVLPGEPTFSDGDCAQGKMVQFRCALPAGSSCTKHEECDSRACTNGKCANPCTVNEDCPVGTTCDPDINLCRLLKGAFCIPGTAQADACQSGKCSGFPPRCE